MQYDFAVSFPRVLNVMVAIVLAGFPYIQFNVTLFRISELN
jgi:hypothetical protein